MLSDDIVSYDSSMFHCKMQLSVDNHHDYVNIPVHDGTRLFMCHVDNQFSSVVV